MSLNDVLGVIGIIEVPVIGFCVWLVKKIHQHDIALAVLLEEIARPGNKNTMRSMLNEVKDSVTRD